MITPTEGGSSPASRLILAASRLGSRCSSIRLIAAVSPWMFSHSWSLLSFSLRLSANQCPAEPVAPSVPFLIWEKNSAPATSPMVAWVRSSPSALLVILVYRSLASSLAITRSLPGRCSVPRYRYAVRRMPGASTFSASGPMLPTSRARLPTVLAVLPGRVAVASA